MIVNQLLFVILACLILTSKAQPSPEEWTFQPQAQVIDRSWSFKKCCSYESFQQLINSDAVTDNRQSRLCTYRENASGSRWSTCSRQCVVYDTKKCLRSKSMFLHQCPDSDCQDSIWTSWSDCRQECVRASCYGDKCGSSNYGGNTLTVYFHSCKPAECQSDKTSLRLEDLSSHVRAAGSKSPCRKTCLRSRALIRHCQQGCKTVRSDMEPCQDCWLVDKVKGDEDFKEFNDVDEGGLNRGFNALSPYEGMLAEHVMMSEALMEMQHNEREEFYARNENI